MAALLFKVLTQYLQKPTVSLTDVLPEVANIPAEPQSQEISHRKALYLQGSAPLQHLLPVVLHMTIPASRDFMLLIQQSLPCTGILCNVCPSTNHLVCLCSTRVTVDSVLCVPVGFLHGLCEALLPDTYTELGCGIRPHVLSTQKVLDPFSPFLLGLPPTLPPMWSASSPEGGRDVVQGNLIPAGQRTSLLQCSRYRNNQCTCTHTSRDIVELCRIQ